MYFNSTAQDILLSEVEQQMCPPPKSKNIIPKESQVILTPEVENPQASLPDIKNTVAKILPA